MAKLIKQERDHISARSTGPPCVRAKYSKTALKQNAASIIVCHNHQSGDFTPSPEDVAVMRQLVKAGRVLGVEVLDLLIIGYGHLVILRERRLGFAS